MQKPVHIVPMWDKNTRSMKDTIMPGIGLYRIQAARSNQYAGVSEPEYGNTIDATLDGVKVSYPEWSKVTVKKLIGNQVVEFTAKEYWLENYATSKKDSSAPNAMWLKRPFGQLAKCAEAQALRKAFPEIITQQPTAEEMEGKNFMDHAQSSRENGNNFKSLNSQIDEYLIDAVDEDSESGQLKILHDLIFKHDISRAVIDKWCKKASVENLAELDNQKVEACIEYIVNNYKETEDVGSI